MIIQCIQTKYGISVNPDGVNSISMEEIEDTIPEIMPIGSDLVIRMFEAELDRIK
jgi:hypothetical protein